MEDLHKFYSNFTIADTRDCWRWQGIHDANGYPRFKAKGKNLAAHKLMYEMNFGPVKPGEFVYHTCPNRDCMNPRHLWSGSMSAYHKYMAVRGGVANPKGSRVKISKLKEFDIPEIKRLRVQGLTQASIAKQFQVSQVTVSNILNNKVWKVRSSVEATKSGRTKHPSKDNKAS